MSDIPIVFVFGEQGARASFRREVYRENAQVRFGRSRMFRAQISNVFEHTHEARAAYAPFLAGPKFVRNIF